VIVGAGSLELVGAFIDGEFLGQDEVTAMNRGLSGTE
jgi:hypothetical protein